MITDFVTSDLHLGHATGATVFRDFSSVAEHDAMILARIREAVRGIATPRLFILGDVALGGWRNSITQLRELPFEVHVVLGNHDRPAPNMSNGHNYLQEFMALGGFASVQTVARVQGFVLSHYPYDNAPGEAGNSDDFEEWRLRDRGIPLLHGHTHSKERFSLSSSGTPQVHVGVDAWGFKPVNIREIKELLLSH